MPVPKIPGQEVEPGRAYELIGRVAALCHMDSKRYSHYQVETQLFILQVENTSQLTLLIRFPGSQPVSFSKADVARLENEESVPTCISISPL